MNRNTSLKKEDIRSIRRCFYEGGLHTKTELSQHTGLSLAGATNVLQELVRRGEIRHVSDAASTGGRRSKQYALNEEYAHIALIYCHRHEDVFYLDAETMNLSGKKVFAKRAACRQDAWNQVSELYGETILNDSQVKTSVIVIPGVSDNGVVRFCDIPDFERKDFRTFLKGIQAVENDVNTAAIGFAHRHGVRNTAFLYQPDAEYSGSGIIINGRLYNGASHMAGEMRFLDGEQPAQMLLKPVDALRHDLCTLQAVLDPELIGWNSDLVREEELNGILKGKIHLVHEESMSELIKEGGLAMGKDLLLRGEN